MAIITRTGSRTRCRGSCTRCARPRRRRRPSRLRRSGNFAEQDVPPGGRSKDRPFLLNSVKSQLPTPQFPTKSQRPTPNSQPNSQLPTQLPTPNPPPNSQPNSQLPTPPPTPHPTPNSPPNSQLPTQLPTPNPTPNSQPTFQRSNLQPPTSNLRQGAKRLSCDVLSFRSEWRTWSSFTER